MANSTNIKVDINLLRSQKKDLAAQALLAEQQNQLFNDLLKKFSDSTSGTIKSNVYFKGAVATNKYKKVSENLRYGADVLERCITSFDAAQKDTTKKILNMDTVIFNDGKYPGATSTSTQQIYKIKTLSVPSGHKVREPEVFGGYKSLCSSMAFSTALSIKRKQPVDPHRYTVTRKNSDGTTYQECLWEGYYDQWDKKPNWKKVYNNISKGNPALIHYYFNYKNGTESQHYVTVVGVRDGADPNNPKPSDFLIIDSSGSGKPVPFSEAFAGGNGKSIRINRVNYMEG